MNVTSSSNVEYCQWSIFIYNCVDSQYYVGIYYGNLITSVIVALFSGSLLIYRRRVHRDVELFSDGLFAPLEGFLGFAFASVIMRIVCSGIFLSNAFPSNYAVRALFDDLPWFLGQASVMTYLAGVLNTIPRIAFFQPTSSTSKFLIPSDRFTRICYWFLLIFQYVFAQGSSFLYGFFRMRNNYDDTLSEAFIATRLSSYTITSVILTLGFGIYGRLLVNLTKQSFELVQEQGGVVEEFGDTSVEGIIKDRSGQDNKKVFFLNKERGAGDVGLRNLRFKWYLRKMQIFNLAITTTLSFWSIATFILAFWQEEIWSTLAASKIHMFIADIGTECVYFVVLVGVLLSEIKPNWKHKPLESMINSSSNPPTQSISISA